MYLRLCLTLLFVMSCSSQHRAAPPGVNPQQYQQQQMHQQQQQPQYQQQGAPGVPPPQNYQAAPGVPPPQQYQQGVPSQQIQQGVPAQQFQQQPPQQVAQQPQQVVQQPPQQQFQQQQIPQVQQNQHQGAPHHPHGAQKVLHKTNLNDERAHIKDHLEVPLDTSGMSEQELQFHYFKMHDADNNNRLDGQELIKSLFHWHDEANHDDPAKEGHAPPSGDKIFTDDELTNMIDPILLQDDHNGDGYIDYSEFMAAQKKAGTTAE